ncbi:hypothetical protein G7085_14625 [Tessaracoccus sp. HDW20]|uniref:hypothetical protein n=1 Tax=Tessaracoccus coleopterorum TaxID=2714950 RepID=UPI0018D43A96|nr:hypothetical protein [Tessaracoccus coleopterorum]NHB85434.1 hypothetical protein [Tessaracoccus coleopterorum]
MPGMPEKPIADHAVFPAEKNENADRQLDYKAAGTPRVEFLDSPGDHAAYAAQVVNWELCADSETDLCAKVLAPLVWDEPQGDAIELAVRRIPNAGSKLGPLFVNPGGRGSGVRTSPGRWPTGGRSTTRRLGSAGNRGIHPCRVRRTRADRCPHEPRHEPR